MPGLEILGAAASAVQLASTCYIVQKRLRQLPCDRQLTKTIEIECGDLIAEINANRALAEQEACEQLCRRLRGLKARIEKRKTAKWTLAKVSKVLQLNGIAYKDEFITILQEYQTRAAMVGNGFAQETLEIVKEIRMTTKSSDTQNTESCSKLKAMKEELNKLRSSLRAIEALGEEIKVQKTVVESESKTMLEYVESVKTGGGGLSDREIWECVWDCTEAYQLFGCTVLNPHHRRAEKKKEIKQKLLQEPGQGQEQTRRRGRLHWKVAEEVEKLEPFGIWTCLGILQPFHAMSRLIIIELFKMTAYPRGTRRLSWKFEV